VGTFLLKRVRFFTSLTTHIHTPTQQWFAGGSESLDLGLATDTFSDSIWASYIMFIDIGTQTAMKTTDEGMTLLIAVCISIVGFVFLLLVLGVIVDVVRKILDFYETHHARIIANGHTVILGWSDKALFLLDEMVRDLSMLERESREHRSLSLFPSPYLSLSLPHTHTHTHTHRHK